MDEQTQRQVDADWFRTAFGALYPLVYAHRTVKAAEPEAAFAARQVALKSGERVLDLACGNGRHLVHLLKARAEAVGLDYSGDLLALARQSAGPDVRLVRGDMRALPFSRTFDVVFNFFTSFGYFTDPAENARVVTGVAEVLKPAGRFFIDYLNAAFVERTLVPHSVRHSGDIEIRETRWIDSEARRVNKSMQVYRDGVSIHESGESVQLYSPEEFCTLLQRGGLVVDRMFGDYTGAPMSDELPRMIAVGHKG